MSGADITLSVGLDARGAESDAKRLGASIGDAIATEVGQRVTKSLKDIMARATGPGGSLPGGGARPGGSGGNSAVQQAIANERAYQSALTRTESMVQRIGRQMSGNADMTARAQAALTTYNGTLQSFGTRSMEGVRAQGQFARAMNTLNSEIAASNGLLVTLNRGFGSLSGQLGTIASGVSVVGGRVGAVAGTFAGVTSAVGTSTRALVAFGAAAGALVAVPVAVAAIGAAALVAGAAMAEVTDRFNGMIGKLNASTGSMTAANALFAETFAIAKRVGVAVDDVGTSMNRFAGVGKDIGLTNAEVSGLVETFLKLGKVSGQTAQEAASSLTQLTQALASGRLQGDEYRALSEAMPALTREIAKAMGVATGELKKLASEGMVTTDIVLRALGSMKDKINADFATIPETVAQINARIANEWDMLLSNLDKKLHLSDFYKAMLKLPLMAIEGANKLVGPKTGTDRAKELQGQIADVDDKIRRTPFEWARKGLRDERAELVKELDGLQTDMVRSAVDAGQQTIDADNKAWQQRVDTAKRGAKEIREANDPIFKANEEYRRSVEKLTKDKALLSPEDYQATLDAITATRDAAIERAEKSANKLTIEEKAVWNVTESYSALRLELSNAKIATEALQAGDFTLIDLKANDRVVDFLVHFAKQANVVGKSLEELSSMAGISLKDLRDGFRGIEVELAKQNALKRSKDLTTETEETNRLAAATLEGAKAEAEMTKAIEVERAIRQLGLDAKDKDLVALRDEIRLKLQASEAAKEYQRAAQEGRSILEQYGDGATQLRLRLERLNETRRVLAEKGGLTTEMADAFDRAAFEATKSTNTIQGVFARTADNVGQAWDRMFDKVCEGGKVTFRDFTDTLKGIFTKAITEMAYIAPVRPINVPLFALVTAEEGAQ